jgi:hypothetical protein
MKREVLQRWQLQPFYDDLEFIMKKGKGTGRFKSTILYCITMEQNVKIQPFISLKGIGKQLPTSKKTPNCLP